MRAGGVHFHPHDFCLFQGIRANSLTKDSQSTVAASPFAFTLAQAKELAAKR